ncbi:NADH-quinone oxidoreductase subunit J [Alterisphingorhabdus coralli]|uniref:NADH-quinone oxidoreductase subunit J n=1 Tax=Alterisphingorhabdus coralli TaxID=3071408 RepID=A0AA97F619_9SPHN|nr:NADH-quinone oxidoreductase subunit J [Parasphingorhabdus sp. SCSIO 66989]WOE73927.1 NADH-quinone oxidoreductase subunit J [Parasphingorhabdus sp. SCSIO 66989]
MIQIFAFYLFAAILIASGAFVILSRNPVHSVLWLIMAFFNAAGLMILVGAELIAMLLVIVYVGAVAVLFLFVVMMLDIDFAELRAGFIKNVPLGLALAFLFLAELILGIGAYQAGSVTLADSAVNPARDGATNTQAVGELLYGKYPFLFEAAGVILLVAMVGAIVLTLRQRAGVRPQNVARQVSRRPEEAVRNTQPEVGKGVSL